MLAMFGYPGWMEVAILIGLILLIFGRRVPSMAKYLGRALVEFKRGLKGS